MNAERDSLILARSGCPFCNYAGPSLIEAEWPEPDGAILFRPLNPVTAGHRIVVPTRHVASAADDPALAGEMLALAADYAKKRYDSFNLITSVGSPATQTVEHLHIHVVPRWPNDGLKLPWSEA